MNPIWLKQVRGVMRLELRKTLFSGRAVPLYGLALLPVAIITLFVLVNLAFNDPDDIPYRSAPLFFAGIFTFISRGLLYLGCVWTFTNLFRGDILDRSLHYYFLSPIRREVLVAGKFVAGFVTTSAFFVFSVVASMLIFYSYYGIGQMTDYLFSGQGLGHMVAYVSITVMACLGYGAVFMLIGLFLKNPIIPAFLIFGWEWINPFLPALLKKFSVIFYLESLLPVRLPSSPYAVIADPVPIWLGLPGFLLFTAATLSVAGFMIRRREISYADE